MKKILKRETAKKVTLTILVVTFVVGHVIALFLNNPTEKMDAYCQFLRTFFIALDVVVAVVAISSIVKKKNK